MPGVKVKPTDNDTVCKIIIKSHMKCCGILYAFCNTFSVYLYLLLYIRKFLRQSLPICRYLSTNLCCEILFRGKEHFNKLCLYSVFFTVGSYWPHGTVNVTLSWYQSRVKGQICAHQRVVQEAVSIHDTISLRRLHSLGKCHDENLSKAACLAVILAYATEEETVYRKRKRSIWTKDWLKRRSV